MLSSWLQRRRRTESRGYWIYGLRLPLPCSMLSPPFCAGRCGIAPRACGSAMTGWSGFVTVTFTIISFFLSRNATTANFFFAGRRIIRCRGVATAIADKIDACEGGVYGARQPELRRDAGHDPPRLRTSRCVCRRLRPGCYSSLCCNA